MPLADDGAPAIRINRWFADHPDMVLGRLAIASEQYGETYTWLSLGSDLETALPTAIERLPIGIYSGDPSPVDFELEEEVAGAMAERPDDPKVREGSFFIDKATALMQIGDGHPTPVEVKKGRGADGVFAKHARIIRKLIPIRDVVQSVLKLQERDQPWKQRRSL